MELTKLSLTLFPNILLTLHRAVDCLLSFRNFHQVDSSLKLNLYTRQRKVFYVLVDKPARYSKLVYLPHFAEVNFP